MGQTKNIYRIARETAGLTQARWAEAIGVSVDAVGQYEAGIITPVDFVAAKMAEVSGMMILGYWHLKNKSSIANDELPDIDSVPIAQAVLNLVYELSRFEQAHTDDALIGMAKNGKIDAIEKDDFDRIVGDLEGIIRAALMVKYAERD